MIVYHYDPETFAYLYTSSEADEDPLEPGHFLIPANATDLVPPSVADPTKQQQVFADGAWSIQLKPVEPVINKNVAEAPAGLFPRMTIKEALKGGVS